MAQDAEKMTPRERRQGVAMLKLAASVLVAMLVSGASPESTQAPLIYKSQIEEVTSSKILALISETDDQGEVYIDWELVDKVLADKSDRYTSMRGYARLMAAIRDGTWKPMAQRP